MIRFLNVSKSYPTSVGRRVILDQATFVLPRANIGILGGNGAGKSTLIRMIAGAELPDKGRILRMVKVSWPLGFSGGIHLAMTGLENLRFIARIYGEDIARVRDFVEEFTELGAYLSLPVSTYSSGMRAKLAFGISMAIDFDCYLVDEITAVGDKTFQERCRQAFADKRKNANVIIVSHSEATIRSYCEKVAILDSGRLEFFDDVEEAIDSYNEMVAAP